MLAEVQIANKRGSNSLLPFFFSFPLSPGGRISNAILSATGVRNTQVPSFVMNGDNTKANKPTLKINVAIDGLRHNKNLRSNFANLRSRNDQRNNQ